MHSAMVQAALLRFLPLPALGLLKGLPVLGQESFVSLGRPRPKTSALTSLSRIPLRTPRFLLAGKDPKGHQSGRTLLALWENGVDENRKVVGSPGRRPILRNVTHKEVEAFRKQAQVVDMIGCEDEEKIVEKLKELSRRLDLCSCKETREPVRISEVPIIHAEQPAKVEMDKAGYFVILPQPDKQMIVVEHYSYDNTLQRVIDGKDARSIYWTIIRNGWVTQLSHAAYLGKELAKAELSIKLGMKIRSGWRLSSLTRA